MANNLTITDTLLVLHSEIEDFNTVYEYFCPPILKKKLNYT